MDKKKVKNNKNNFFKKLLNKIKLFFKKLVEKFKKLEPLYQKICYCWGILIIVLIVLLSLLNFKSKDVSAYTEWEDKLEEAALRYVKNKELYPLGSKPLILSDDALVKERFLLSDEVPDKSCLSYVKIIYSVPNTSEDGEGEYVINAYINCKNYTTEGYSDNK